MEQVADTVSGKEFLKLSVQDNTCCVCVCDKNKDDDVDAVDNKSGSKLQLIKLLFSCCYKVQNADETEITETKQ